MSSAERTLILLRHGKSGYPPGAADRDRPLTPRGEREAALAGDWLRTAQPAIDAVLCSSAIRTRQTLERTGIDAPVQFVDALYGAEADEVIAQISETGPAVGALLVVGHFPGLPEAALVLDRGRNPELENTIAAKFPTSALAVLHTGREWTQIHSEGARLADFHVPR